MASISVKLPDNLKQEIERKAEEAGYMNTSEYIRQAMREKIKEEIDLNKDEIEKVMEEKGIEKEGHNLDKVREEIHEAKEELDEE